jgi:hypothetical protein
MGNVINIPVSFWGDPVATSSALPPSGVVGEARIVLDTNSAVIWSGSAWVALTVTAFSGLTASRALQSSAAGALEVSSVTSTELGYLSGVTSAIQTQLNSKESKHTYHLTVGAGGDYATIALANTAAGALALSASQRCLITILPGTYIEDVTGVNFVDYEGSGFANTIIIGKLDLCSSDSHAYSLGVSFTPSADGQIGFCLGTGFGQDVFVYVTASADWSFTGIKATGTTGPSGMINCAAFITDTGASSKNYVGMELDGAAFVAALNCAVEINSTSSSSGTQTGLLLTNSGELAVSNTRVYVKHDAGFTGTVRLQSVTGTPTPCQIVNPFFKAEGAGSGTCVAFHCDSGGSGALVNVNYPSVDVTGYTTPFTGADTAATDEQNIRQFAANQSASITGAGSLLATPYDDKKTGFVTWIDSGAYWSRTTDQFTVLRGGKGYVRGTTCRFAGSQTITLVSGINYVYATPAGVIATTPTKTVALYEDNIVLFTVLFEPVADVATVVKENHPYDFDTAVSGYAHDILGILIGTTGADIGVLNTAARTISLTGDATLSDHGLDTSIPDSSAVALSVQYWYYDGSKWVLHSTASAIPTVWNSAGTPTALSAPATRYTAHRLYVTKDSLNATTPQYICILNQAAYSSTGAMDTAITNGTITAKSGAIDGLELAQLGYLRVDVTNGFLSAVIEKSQIGTTISVAGTTATSAGAVVLDTTTFGNLLSGSQTSSQSAFEIIDNLDPDSNRAISIGGTNATDVNIGRTGQTAKVLGALTVAEGLVVTGNIGTAATTDYVLLGPDADNSWRFGVDSGNLIMQKKVSGTWTTQAIVGV